MTRPLLLAFLVAFLVGFSDAQAQKPRVPPHRDPGGVLVAMLGPGIDYTQAELAGRLARDGEGELIGWDMVDNDRQPYDAKSGASPSEHGGDATALANLLLAGAAPARLAPLRVDPANPVGLARAVQVVSQMGARIVLVPMWSSEAAAWEPFRQAAMRSPNILFVLAAADGAAPERAYPAAFGLGNAIVLSAGRTVAQTTGFAGAARTASGGHLGAVLAARTAAEVLARDPGLDIARLKTAIETQTQGRQ